MAERLPFHQQLRYERKLRGWSQEDVASKVGCGPKTVMRWENGESLPHPYSQQRLCELFGKNAEELGLLGEQAEDIDAVSDRSSGNQPGEAGKRLPWEYTSGTGGSLPALGTLLCSYDIHSHWVLAVAWSPDGPSSSPGCGSRIASAGGDGTVQIWHAGTGQHILTYRGHAHKGILDKTKFVPRIYNLAWSPDGQRIASAGDAADQQMGRTGTAETVAWYEAGSLSGPGWRSESVGGPGRPAVCAHFAGGVRVAARGA